MAFQEAREDFGKTLRWTQQGDDSKSTFIGTEVTGYYKEKKDNIGPNESSIHVIKLLDGKLVSVWGSELLDGKFAKVPFGAMLRITFLGLQKPKTPNGRPYNNFKVEFDADSRDFKEATNVQAGSQQAHNEQAVADAADEGY